MPLALYHPSGHWDISLSTDKGGTGRSKEGGKHIGLQDDSESEEFSLFIGKTPVCKLGNGVAHSGTSKDTVFDPR